MYIGIDAAAEDSGPALLGSPGAAQAQTVVRSGTDRAGLQAESPCPAPHGTLALNLDTIAGDDTVNIAEKAAGLTISGDTGSEGGASVTVMVGTTELTATSDSDGAWSVDVPADAAYITGTSVAVTVSASKTGFTSPSDVTRTLAVDLAAPSVSYPAPSSLKVGAAISAMTPSTSATDIASYSAADLPSGLGIDSTRGAISGTPDTADANPASATVTVTDTAGNSAEMPIAFPTVAKGDRTLTGFTYSPASVTFGDTAPTVTAPTGAQTTLRYAAVPSTVCTVDSTTGVLTLVGAGSCEITARAASNDDYNEATATFTVTVVATDIVPATLAPAWGAAEGNAERLWSLGDARGLPGDDGSEPGSRLDAEVGYGFAVLGGRGVATPHAGLRRSGESEALRLGQRLKLDASLWSVESEFAEDHRTLRAGYGYRPGDALELSLEATRREPADDGAPEHGVMLRIRARW